MAITQNVHKFAGKFPSYLLQKIYIDTLRQNVKITDYVRQNLYLKNYLLY